MGFGVKVLGCRGLESWLDGVGSRGRGLGFNGSNSFLKVLSGFSLVFAILYVLLHGSSWFWVLLNGFT